MRSSPIRLGEVGPRAGFLVCRIFMHGAWGLGCLWCAASKDSPAVQRMRRAHSQQNKAAGRCKQAISRASIWSSYGINTICTPRDLHKQIEQHEATDLHHISQHCFSSSQCHLDYATMKDPRGQAMHRTAHSRDSELCAQPVARCGQPCDAPGAACGAQAAATAPYQPKAEPVVGCIQEVDIGHVASSEHPMCHSESVAMQKSEEVTLGSVADPFRGRVPQVQQWIDCWADTTSSVSNLGKCLQI